MAFICSLRKYSLWLFEIFSLICSWILFWIRRSSCSLLMKTRAFSMRFWTSMVSSISCCSERWTLRMLATKSAILPGWSMLTMLTRISSVNSGLFSDTLRISAMRARVSALTSRVSRFSSSRYSTPAERGGTSERYFMTRKRLTVWMKMLMPPSGRLILRTILAAVPTWCRSFGAGLRVSSSLVRTRPT